MAKKKNNKQPWSSSLESREALYKGVNPSADFDPLSIATQTIGYLGGFRTGHGMPEDEARWAAYLGLPYDKTYAPDTKIRFEGDENYPDRQYQGLSKRAKNEVRKKIIPQAKRIKDKYNKEWIQVLDTKPNSEYNDATIYHDRQNYLGDLGKFGIREVGESGIYEVGDKYDFPALIPIPDRNEGTELMVRDTIWSDRANPKLYNQEVIKRKNKHDIGGFLSNIGSKLDGWNTNLTDKFLDSGIGKGLSSFGIKAGGLGGIANTAATAIGGALAGGRTSGVGNALQGIGSLASNIPGVGGLIGAGVNMVGGLVNAAFGSKLNAENIANVESSINKALSFNSNASDYDALTSNYANLQGVMGFNKDYIGSDGWFSKKAKKKYNALQAAAKEAEDYQISSLENNAENIATTAHANLLANYNAYGGIINRFDNGGETQDSENSTLNTVNELNETRNKFRNLTGEVNPFLDDWFSKRLSTGRFDAQLGEGRLERQKQSRDTAPIVSSKNAAAKLGALRTTPVMSISSDTPEDVKNRYKQMLESEGQTIAKSIKGDNLGSYFPSPHMIYVRDKGNTLTLTHEQTHASKPWEQENVIKSYFENKNKYFNPYLDAENEIYSRLMQLRQANNIDPLKVWDKDSLKEFKKNAVDFNLLNRYDDDTLLYLFNDVAINENSSNNVLLPEVNETKIAAYGGPIGNQFKDGGIYIKPNKRGTFTTAAKKRGNSLGGDFSNGVIQINSGGLHSTNPYEGVQMGVDPQGIPNLVEEGEVIYDDYVFSNRLRVPKEVRQKYKLRGVTFADAAKQLQKESEERPNDPISKNGLDASMSMLQQEQEAVRMKKESNKYAKGGKLGTLYEGEGSKSNWLRYAPIAGHAIGAFSDLFSSPDYSAANAIEAVNITPATVGYTPVGNYLSYKPFDRDYYLNKLNADTAATRRAITNTSGGNRAAAMAGLLAADYNYGNQLGVLSRQAEEYNQALRERVEGFNRQTNLANAEMGLKAAMANAESRNQATKLSLSQAGQVAAMRKAAKDAYDARRSNNINVLLEELGGLGTENWNRDWLDRLAKAGVFKIDSKGNPVISRAKGGKIRTKKKKGFTYG